MSHLSKSAEVLEGKTSHSEKKSAQGSIETSKQKSQQLVSKPPRKKGYLMTYETYDFRGELTSSDDENDILKVESNVKYYTTHEKMKGNLEKLQQK